MILPTLVLMAATVGSVGPAIAPIPDAPKPAPTIHLDRTQWALLTIDAGVRGLDVYSTRRMLQGPNHEMFLPDVISHHVPMMIAYSAGTVGMNYLAARELVKHHHPRLAKLVVMVDVGQDAPWAIHNLYLKTR